MRRISLLFAAFTLLLSSVASAEIVKVPSTVVGATQEGVGVSNVGEIIKTQMANHKKDPKYRNKPFKTYLKEVLKPKFEGKPFPGIIDPHGTVRILDGHHRAKMVTILSAKYGVRMKVAVDVSVNFKPDMDRAKNQAQRDRVFAKYAKHLVNTMGKGQFTKYTEGKFPLKNGTKALVERVKRFTLVANVKDDPMRAAIGQAMFKAGIDSDHFADYIEFKIARWLSRDPATNRRIRTALKAHGPVSPKTVETIQSALLTERGHNYLAKNMRPGSEGAARKVLATVWKKPARTAKAQPAWLGSMKKATPRKPKAKTARASRNARTAKNRSRSRARRAPARVR